MKAFCRRLILWLLLVVMLAAVLVCDMPVAFAEEPPADSSAPTEPVEPPTESPQPTDQPAGPELMPVPPENALPEDMMDLPDITDSGVLMQSVAQMEATATSGDYDYAINGDGISVTITNYRGNDADVVIPSTLGGMSVTAIGDSAFADRQKLKSVTIPNTVNSIGADVFYQCASLLNINVADGNTAYSSQNGVLFNKAGTRLIRYPSGKTDVNYTVPSGVSIIGDRAFEACQMEDITIPEGMTEIGSDAFVGGKIARIDIPDSVTKIGAYAFNNCQNLIGCRIPDRITTLESGTFSGCIFLVEVVIPDSVTSIESYAFANSPELRSIVIPENVVAIEGHAFACTKLSRVDFYGDAPVVHPTAFDHCAEELMVYYDKTKSGFTDSWFNHLTVACDTEELAVRNLTAHAGVGLGYDYWVGSAGVAIANYTGSETRVTIPSKIEECPVTIIGRNTFYGNSRLTRVQIPEGVIRIGAAAFYACYNIEDVRFPASVREIDTVAFTGCVSLPTLNLPSSLNVIGLGAFNSCRKLIKVVIPDSVQKICTGAFSGCDRMKITVIPKSVEIIESAAFAASGLVKAFFLGNAPAIVETDTQGVFDGCAPGFTVNYIKGATGFTNPWHGYATQTFDPKAKFTVTFDTKGGPKLPPVTGGYDLLITDPGKLTWTGYEFLGWYLTPADGVYGADFPIVVSNDMTIYAGWSPINCWVSYWALGKSISSERVLQGTVINSSPIPAIDGYFFADWYPTREFDTAPVSFPYTVTQKQTVFYAKTVPIGAYLADFSLSAGTLSNPFNPSVKKYTVTLAENEPGVTLTAGVFSGVSMTINGKAVSSTTVTLANGKSKTVSIKVKYGKKSTTYQFKVIRLKSGDNNLGSLAGSAGTMNQPFDPNVTNYTLKLDENTSRVTLRAVKANASAKVSPASKKLTLKNGQTKMVKFTVKAQSGAKKVYTVTVTRAPSTNANLKTLKTSVPLSPGFHAGVTDYTVTLPADKSTVTVSAKAADKLSAVTIGGLKKSSQKVTLENGQSVTVSVLVTSQAGTTKEYRITIQRP